MRKRWWAKGIMLEISRVENAAGRALCPSARDTSRHRGIDRRRHDELQYSAAAANSFTTPTDVSVFGGTFSRPFRWADVHFGTPSAVYSSVH